MLYVGSLASTAILGRILFKEKFTPKHILSLGLVITGLLFFVYPFGKDSLTLGILFGLMAGIFEGSSHVLRKLMKDVKREVIVFYQNCSAVIIATIFVLVSTEPFMRQFSIEGIIIAVIFGALLVVIGYLLVYGFQNFDVNWGTIILATEVFFATVINAVFLKEIPTTLEVIGGLLIFSGTIVTSLRLGQKNKTKV
jgi:drug/metabolite transporter (DMT)-like permease